MRSVAPSLLFLLFLCSACEKHTPPEAGPPLDKLFTLLPPSFTGIDFVNELEYREDYNPYIFRNFFNGGGVGLGDINNDGLLDLFFCGNLVENRLYLNEGNFHFEDITKRAGVASKGAWTTGVSFADVNGDGWLDIYLCKSGDPQSNNRHNELFINNADPARPGTFTEMAAAYGLDDLGLSNHAAFFDYDKDGDLDCYLLNNSIRSVGGYELVKDQRKIRDPEGGNKLYRNDGGRFTDVSEQAGIYGSNIGFGLGVTIGDVNRDSWPDIFVSNDFFERDYLYINEQDGTFSEVLEEQMREISMGSMGADMADINNDGFPEIFVTDMLPEDNARMKTKTTFESWDKYRFNVENGYSHQFTRNVLHLNNADNTFSEIGRLAGVFATDWSWGALIMDINNDGFKDIFVANGIYKDLTDQDYLNFYADPATVRAMMKKEKNAITKLIDAIPSEPLANYAFINNPGGQGEGLVFQDRAEELGLGKPGFSNGSAYGDLDNDGDLDLVVNNVNMPPFIYRNETDTLLQPNNNFLSLELKGEGKNTFALGAQVTIRHKGRTYYQEQNPMRGFQSSVDHRIHFGLGSIGRIDSLIIAWPDGRFSLFTDLPVKRMLSVQQSDASLTNSSLQGKAENLLFQAITEDEPIEYTHIENDFSDFDRDRLIYNMLSSDGPKMCKGDVNGDGRMDVFVGGAKDSPGALFVQQGNGGFVRTNEVLFTNDKTSEDTDCIFFDADNDRDLDLYVASGGNEFPSSSSALLDRLYINDGRGNFSKSGQLLPTAIFESTSCIQAADFDSDGDQDLFAGIRLRPFLYGVPVNGYILENDGKGNFRNVSAEVAPGLSEIGMITDALWLDYDGDRDEDLILVGEWMPLTIFKNDKGKFKNVTAELGLSNTRGWWNCLKTGDFDQDGDMDLVLGNHGLNTRLKVSADKPARMYINDFDQNGTAEQILCVYNGEASYPLVLKHDLVNQIPGLRDKYPNYESYKDQTISDIFSPAQLENAIVLEVNTSATSLAINRGDGTFEMRELPLQAQFSPIYGLLVEDFDRDGKLDILMGGNFHRSKPEIGMYDASYGLFLKGDGANKFEAIPAKDSGFRVVGEIRDLLMIKSGEQELVLAAMNDDKMRVFLAIARKDR